MFHSTTKYKNIWPIYRWIPYAEKCFEIYIIKYICRKYIFDFIKNSILISFTLKNTVLNVI